MVNPLCLIEAEKDSIELSLRKRKEDLINQGDLESADVVEGSIIAIENLEPCAE